MVGVKSIYETVQQNEFFSKYLKKTEVFKYRKMLYINGHIHSMSIVVVSLAEILEFERCAV